MPKITSLTADTSPSVDDLIVTVNDPSGTPVNRKVTLQDLMKLISGKILLEEHVASDSATLDFTTRNKSGYTGASFQSDFDEYIFEFINIIPATTGANFYMRTGAGSFDSGANYRNLGWYLGIGDSFTSIGESAQNQGKLAQSVSTTANWSLNGFQKLYNPGSSIYKQLISKISSPAAGTLYSWDITQIWLSTSAADRIQYLFSSGNIASGTIRCYGIRK